MELLETLHNRVRRLGDAIFCLEDIDARPNFVEILKKDLQEAYQEYQDEQNRPKEKSSYKKEIIPAKIRWEVWERDNFTCRHCGKRKNLTVDHIYPEVKGGTLELSNLQTLCKKCNSKKGAS